MEIADIVYFGTRSQPRSEVGFRPLKLIKTYLKLIKTRFHEFGLWITRPDRMPVSPHLVPHAAER